MARHQIGNLKVRRRHTAAPSPSLFGHVQWERRTHVHAAHLQVTQQRHDRIIAEKDSEIERLRAKEEKCKTEDLAYRNDKLKQKEKQFKTQELAAEWGLAWRRPVVPKAPRKGGPVPRAQKWEDTT